MTLKTASIVGALVLSWPALGADKTVPDDAQLAKAECGACHYYYPGNFLPAYSWKVLIPRGVSIMDNLDDHFGEVASLDEDSARRILRYLAEGRVGETPPPGGEIPLRVTGTAWWRRAHGPTLRDSSAWDHIRMANCKTCHGLWKLSPTGIGGGIGGPLY